MNNSMIAASVTMGALQQKLDILADNMANANTVGYKRKNVVFQDILTNLYPHEEKFELPGRRTPLGFTQGWGGKLSTMQLDLTQGVLKQTDNYTDVAIEGNGLFEVRSSTDIGAARAFTRHGSFQLMSMAGGERMLVTNSGYPIVAEAGGADTFISVPDGYSLAIAPDGRLTAVGIGSTQEIELGRLKLVQVAKPELLQAIGDNLYGVPADVAADDVLFNVTGLAPEDTNLSVRQGFVEQSNVMLADEITDLMVVQRAYQLTARALTSSDQMLGMANNLRA